MEEEEPVTSPDQPVGHQTRRRCAGLRFVLTHDGDCPKRTGAGTGWGDCVDADHRICMNSPFGRYRPRMGGTTRDTRSAAERRSRVGGRHPSSILGDLSANSGVAPRSHDRCAPPATLLSLGAFRQRDDVDVRVRIPTPSRAQGTLHQSALKEAGMSWVVLVRRQGLHGVNGGFVGSKHESSEPSRLR